jgi:RNA-binding protein YhbY
VPFLRVLRDKRGYETTYLMHWFRDGGRQRSKILYVFRTPPGVKVGRDPIDPAVIEEIEAQHPDIEFDWRALRENQQVIDTSAEPRRPRTSRTSGRAEPVEGRRPRKDERERPVPEKPATDRPKPEPAGARSDAVAETPRQPPLVIPTAIDGVTREDKLVFLLNWYLNLRERVPHRTHDPIRREALRALVERLNPEVWVGEEGIAAGLQDAAEALQRLSALFSKRRKRPRRAKADRAETATGSEPAAGDTQVSDDRGPDTDLPDTEASELESDPSE